MNANPVAEPTDKSTDAPSTAAIVPDTRLVIRIDEAARRLSIGRTRAYDLIRTGELPAVRIGGSLRVPVAHLERWIAQQTAAAIGAPSADRRDEQ